MALKLVVRNLEEIQAYMKTVPYGAVKISLPAIADWYIGQDDRALRHLEPYKYVHPFRSYSDDPVKAAKLRRWIFAHLDQIGHENRTGKTADGWKFKSTNNGYGVTFTNGEPGAVWLWSDKKQTRQNAGVGHRKLMSKVQSNLAAAIRHANAAVNKWLRSK